MKDILNNFIYTIKIYFEEANAIVVTLTLSKNYSLNKYANTKKNITGINF